MLSTFSHKRVWMLVVAAGIAALAVPCAAEEAAERVISLPMHPYLTDEQQLTIVQALKDSVLELL